jgi:DNA-binding NarL/FixJ family response regulator
MIRVVLIDDHPVVRTGYRALLEQSGDIQVLAEAQDLVSAYEAFQVHQPDLCITDLSLPGAGGLELLRKILGRDAHARVLVFSMYDSVPVVRRVMDSGAFGFVSKNAAPQDLIAAVKRIQSGNRYLSPELAVLLQPLETNDEVARLATLGAREFEIFRLLAEGKTLIDCAQLLHLSPKTVANHQTQIKEKLGVTSSAALVHWALRHGVIARHDPS